MKHVLSFLTMLAISTAGLHAQSTEMLYWGAGHYNNLIDEMGRFTQNVNGSINNLGWTLDQSASHPSATWSTTVTGASAGSASMAFINDPGQYVTIQFYTNFIKQNLLS